VRRRPDSRFWHYDFWYRGWRYKGSTKQTSKARAQEYEAHQRELVRGGWEPHFTSPHLKDLLSQYMEWLEANNKSPAHIDRARRGLRNVLSRMKRVRVAEDIRPKEIDEYKKQRLGECSPFTVNTELRYLRAFLKRCVKQGWLQSMPAEIEQVSTPQVRGGSFSYQRAK